MKKTSIIHGTIILSIASLITRLLGFSFRIYISNIIGAEGMGLYHLILPIYFLSHTFCCSGISIAISKSIAEENAKKEKLNIRRFLLLGCSISFLLSIFISLLIYCFSTTISTTFLHDKRTILSIRFLVFAIPFSVLNTCIKSFFIGTKNMTIPASTQIFEQLIRIIVILLCTNYFLPKGLTYACLMVIIGTAAGDFFSFIHVWISYKKSYKKFVPAIKQHPKLKKDIIIILFSIGLPLTFNHTFTTLLSSLETILIPAKLTQSGLSSKFALQLYGQLTGMALPLIFFPSVLTHSLSLSLLPTISEAKAVKNQKKISFTVSKSLQLTALIGILFSGIFLTFPYELGNSLYNQTTVGDLLLALSLLCPFIYFQSAFSGVLNGLGLYMHTFKHNLFGLSLRLFIVFFLVPIYGIKAFLIGLLFSTCIVVLLNIHTLLKYTKITFEINNWILKPILSIYCSSFIAKTFGKYIYLYFDKNIIGVLIILALLSGLYCVFILLFKCIKIIEIKKLLKRI